MSTTEDVKRILAVEDDATLGRGLLLALGGPGIQAELCADLASARARLAAGRYDLVLLDVNLPDGSGLDLLAQLKAQGNTPVILLTANDLETDVVAGLELGADDYITKPFSLAILRARMNTQLRRDAGLGTDFSQGPFRFDFARLTFLRDGVPLELSRTEQRLLRLLVENRGRTLPRELLLDRVWPHGAEFVDENALSVTVGRLRGKLGDPGWIKTVYGVGYAWEVEP